MRDGTKPRREPYVIAAGGLLLLVAALVQLVVFDRSIVPLDEGQVATFADRILAGQVLYRDVYTGIFPGIYYFTAALFHLFGRDLIVTRWAEVVINAVTALLLWRIAVRVVRPGWALLAPLLYMIVVALSFPILTMLTYSPLSLACALAALLFLFRYLESAAMADGVAVGLALAASALTKQNFGVLAATAVLVGLLWARPVMPLARRSVLGALAPIVLAGAAASMAAMAYFVATGAFPMLWHYTVSTVFDSQMNAFNQPMPPIFGPQPAHDVRFLFLYAPAFVIGYIMEQDLLFGHAMTPLAWSTMIRLAYGGAMATLAVGPVAVFLTRQSDGSIRSRLTAAVVAFSALMFLGIFPSAIWSHLVAVVAPVLLVTTVVVDRVDHALANRRRLAWAWRAMCGAAVLAVAIIAVRVDLDIRRWDDRPLNIPGASLYVTKWHAKLMNASVSYLHDCAAPGEPVFVAPDMPALYFLAGRPNATRYDMTIPGDVDVDELIATLDASGTRCIVYNPKMYLQFGTFEHLFPKLVDYFENHFDRKASIRSGLALWHGLVRREDPGA